MKVKYLENLIENKEYLDNERFEIVVERYFKNNASYKSLDLVLKYLENYPQQISLISQKLFTSLLSTTEQQLHPLVLFLASRLNIKYNLDLDNLPVEKWSYLMSAFFLKYQDIDHMHILIGNVKNKIDTYKMLMDSPQWFTENKDFFMALHLYQHIDNEELFIKLKANWSTFKITKAAIFYVDIVAKECSRELEFISLLITTLFSLPPGSDDITWLSSHIIKNFQLLNADHDNSMQISDWDALTIKAIKCGLIEENPVYDFIKILQKIIEKIVNIDKSNLAKCFELLVGHSRFTSIMLSHNTNELQKEEVLRLIETLVNKELSLMALSHVPLFLCSYNASLSVTDQLLLRILFHYEHNGIPMSNYRPYLWGSFAVSHYQVKSHLISKTLNSYPSTTEVLSYISLKRLKETLSNFPIDRMLYVKDQNIILFDECINPSKMFDPAFFLPMISSLLGTEAPLSIEKFNTSGCLSLTLACLASHDSSMRLAAYRVLKLLRSHLFCRRAENMFWDHFINFVRKGIQNLHLRPPPQLSMIQALFLSRFVLAIANHEKGIEKACCKLLLNRPAAQLSHVPELKGVLDSFNGADQSSRVQWFLNIICDGMRSEIDLRIFKKMDLLNKLLTIFIFSNEKDRKLVLKIMASTFRLQSENNICIWPINFLMAIKKCASKLSVEEILLVFKCLQSLTSNFYVTNHAVDFWLSIYLDYGDNATVCKEGLITFKKIYFHSVEADQLLEENDLNDILRCAENTKAISDDEAFKCRVVLEHGTNGLQINNPEEYLFLPVLVNIVEKKRNIS